MENNDNNIPEEVLKNYLPITDGSLPLESASNPTHGEDAEAKIANPRGVLPKHSPASVLSDSGKGVAREFTEGEGGDINQPILEREGLRAAIDGLLFVHNRALPMNKLAELLDLTEDDTYQLVSERRRTMEQDSQSGLQIIINDDGVQMATKACISSYIQRLDGQKLVNLTLPALETLSVIAFKQPITKAEISAIRGVNCDGVVSNLLEKKLLYVSGEKPVIGRPRMYSTTQDFLFYFGMKSLDELPVPETDFQGDIPQHPELNPNDFPGSLSEIPEDAVNSLPEVFDGDNFCPKEPDEGCVTPESVDAPPIGGNDALKPFEGDPD